MARRLGYQMPDLLSKEMSSYQGNLRKKNCRTNICRNHLFSFLFSTCLIVQYIGIARANKTEVARNANITSVAQLGSDIGKYGSIDDTFNLLQDGEKLLHLDDSKSVVLVLGNAGSGKTTLTHFLAGNNSKLHSVEVEADTGDYIIKDENDKIGHGVYSKTIVPERVLDTATGLIYYDCLGFGDTRNAAFDIAANYFLKKTVDHARSVKMVFTISYSSVRIGVDRSDFMKLVRHVYELIKDIEKFSDSVALVVNKVDNVYYKTKKALELVSDDKIIEQIAKFIKQTTDAFQARLEVEKNPLKTRFYVKSIFLLDIFLRKKGGKYVNIAMLRRPETDGVLTDSQLLQEEKKSIKNIIENHIVFTKKTREDFGFTVSDNSKNNIFGLVANINRHMLADVSSASHEIEEAMKLKARSGNFYKTRDYMNLIYKELIKQQKILESCNARRKFVQEFINLINSLDIKISRKTFLDILKNNKYLEFLEQVSHQSYGAKPCEWTKPLRDLVEYARKSKVWYDFLTDLYEKLSRYEMHTNFYHEIIRVNGSINIKELVKKLKGYEVKYQEEIHELDLDLSKQQETDSIFKSVYGNSVSFECLEDALVVKGEFLRLSRINFTSLCPEPVKTIKLFALNTVFIDADLIKTGGKVNVFMIAPRWEVIGTRKVVLDGAHQDSKPSRAAPGQDGKPGLPGGTAGNFIGIGIEIIHAKELTISANGGNGGRGQNGGDGTPGLVGQRRLPSGTLEEGEEYMAQEGYKFDRIENIDTNPELPQMITSGRTYHVIEHRHYISNGTKGTAGQDGGLGGAGGKGGFKGKVLIYGLDNAKEVTILSENGSDGDAGTGGVGGTGGANGEQCTIYFETKKTHSFMRKLYSIDSHWNVVSCYSAGYAPDGRNNTNISYASIKNPDDINTFIIHHPVNKYKSYLLNNINNTIHDNLLMKFYSELSDNPAIGESYDSIGFCHELKILEKHFHNLQGTVKMQDLYNSLIKRVDKYSESPKKYEESLAHKKLLNFLHAATLSNIVNLEKDACYDLGVDANSFFAFRINTVEQLKRNAKQPVIVEFNKSYKHTLKIKIKEAESFTKTLITHHLKEDLLRIRHEFNSSMDEILKMQNNSVIKRDEMVQKQRALENSFRTRGIFIALRLFQAGAQIFGPIEEAFCNVIEATSTVTNSLIISEDPLVSNLSGLVPGGVGNLLEEGITRLKEFVRKKASVLKQYMDIILKETQKYSKELKEISTAVSDLKSNLAKAEASQKLNLTLIISTTDQLKEVLTSKVKSILSNSSNNTNQSDKISATLNVLITSMYSVELFIVDYIENQENKSKLMPLINAIQNQQPAIDALRKFQIDIYQTVFPLMELIRENLSKFANETSSNSVAMMSTLHREIVSALKDTKTILRKFTNEFKLQDSTQLHIDKIEETVSLFLKIYEEIDRYNQLKELVDYIADINSVDASHILSDNSTINTALTHLDVMIDYNIVIAQFQRAVHSFKQFVFPFSSYYVLEFDLPNNVTPESHLGTLVSSVKNQIRKLNMKLAEHHLSIQKRTSLYTRHVYEEYFQSSQNYNGPFFIWDGDEYETAISKLLSGEEIVLKSDILTSTHEKNAIKFNKIAINFNSDNKKLLHDLNQHLKHFDVSMKHSGNSYYRCDNNFYLIKSDSQTLVSSFEKDVQGEPVRKNNVYTKIRNGYYILSPYTIWTIQLKPIKKNFRENPLKKFIGNFDLELVGHGQFISAENSICSTDLREFYEPVDTMSVADILYEKV